MAACFGEWGGADCDYGARVGLSVIRLRGFCNRIPAFVTVGGFSTKPGQPLSTHSVGTYAGPPLLQILPPRVKVPIQPARERLGIVDIAFLAILLCAEPPKESASPCAS